MKAKIAATTLALLVIIACERPKCYVMSHYVFKTNEVCVSRNMPDLAILSVKFATCVLKSVWLPGGFALAIGCVITS